MTYGNFMTQMVGVAALGLTTSLGMSEALAQNPSSSSPSLPTASIYRPAPIQAYEMTSRSSRVPSVPGATISESTPWWNQQEGRVAIFGGLCLLIAGFGASVFWAIRNHKDGEGS